MIVGLPGAGISTIFYLLCVLVMPFRALWTLARGRRLLPGEARRLVRLFVIAGAIIIAFLITGALLGALLPQPPATTATASASDGAAPANALPSIIGPAALLFAFATLVVVLGLVRLLAMVLAPVSRPRSVAEAVVPRHAARTPLAPGHPIARHIPHRSEWPYPRSGVALLVPLVSASPPAPGRSQTSGPPAGRPAAR